MPKISVSTVFGRSKPPSDQAGRSVSVKPKVTVAAPATPQVVSPDPVHPVHAHDKIAEELKRGSNISIINLVNTIIEQAQSSRASDIHIDPQVEFVRLRLRIDGVLQDSHQLPKTIHSEI